ncbi:MAG TPA: metalloregulator ArsR/SmtB family transcription factor [Dongiaceae bacterium]|nr:metalloregulator ArsR/SmtB family transcription factor [Dongiaceae bacterium]
MKNKPKPADLRESASRAAQFLRLLANENRLAILCALDEGERSVGDLAAELDTSQPNVSQHLAKLRALDLVTSRRSGTNVLYALRDRDAAAVIAILYRRYCAPAKSGAARRRAA